MLIFEGNRIMMKCVSALLFFIAASGTVHAQKQDATAFHAYCQQYKNDLASVIGQDTAFVSFYKYNPAMVVTATVELLANEPVFKMTTSSGKTKDARKYALLRFTLNGKPYRLFMYQLLMLQAKKETADDLFVPFTDFTCGHGSYGGGRYLDFKLGDIAGGTVTLDLNKAYNPYCAFTTGYNCPIPPRENDIPAAIKAGEQYKAEQFHLSAPSK